jgi:small subunit ribosomal protein S5
VAEYNEFELKEEIISITRVSKVIKGGRRFGFRALVALGDENGTIGLGIGKAREVPDAIRKAVNDAKKHLVKIPVQNGTIPHDIFLKYKGGKILLKRAAPGTCIIAGISVRPILNRAGIKDILSKSLGSNTPITIAKATVEALKSLKWPQPRKEEAAKE